MNPDRVDQIVQFALARASLADDWPDRELGPIHLLKYVYLADLAYAARNGGQSFTDVPWRFHHYGPWAVQAFSRIEPAVEAVHARERTVPSRYSDDSKRWSIERDDSPSLLNQLDRVLPSEVTSAVSRAVREFGHDTSSLLHYVYQTRPMLNAAPESQLDLALVAEPEVEFRASQPAQPAQLSAKQLKRRKEAIRSFRERLREKRLRDASEPSHMVPASPPPRYDEEFERGLEWLDRLAGTTPGAIGGVAIFSDEIWSSRERE